MKIHRLVTTRKAWRVALLLPFFLLASCVQQIFTVQFPQKGGNYVGTQLVDFRVKTSKPVSKADMYLNGTQVGDLFQYSATSATADINKLKPYIRQGANTFSVDPLGGGQMVTFTADFKGPDVVITRGDVLGATKKVEIEGFLRDPSNVSSQMKLNLVVISGYNVDGTAIKTVGANQYITVDSTGHFCACTTAGTSPTVDITSGVTVYRFTATDEHGFETVKEYAADSDEVATMEISNAMRIAIGDTFIESLRPIIASGLYSSLRSSPIDIRATCWDDTHFSNATPSANPAGGLCATTPTVQDGGTFNPGLNPLSVDIGLGNMPTTINRFFMNDGNTANPKTGAKKVATVLLNGFEIRENSQLAVNMIITEMVADLTIDGGWFLGDINLALYIERVGVDTVAIATAVDKKVNVTLDANQSNFALQGISSSKTTIFGINVSGLVNLIMPLLEGLIGDMLPGIINPILNENLQKIVIGARMKQPDTGTKFDAVLNVESLGTGGVLSGEYDLLVGLSSQTDMLVGDPNVTPALGSIFIEDPIAPEEIYNSLGARGTNITFALSSNAVNQALASTYGAGITHYNLVDGVMTFGADDTKPTGTKNGQARMRLYPEMPPFFTLQSTTGGSGGAAQAKLEYESAVLYMDQWDSTKSKWVNKLELGTTISLAVIIDQVDGQFKMSMSGTPLFNINSMVNNTGLPVTQGMLQSAIDVVTLVMVPTLADNFILLDLGAIAETAINGQQVAYTSDQDKLTQTYSHTTACTGTEPAGMCVASSDTCSGSAPACVASKKQYKHVCLTLATTATTGDGQYDLACEVVNFVVNTNTVGSKGAKGSNIFFQMEARDPNIPPAPAIPRLDLDEDGLKDYRENCSVPNGYLTQAITTLAPSGLVYDDPATLGIDAGAHLDVDGNPVNGFEANVKNEINKILAAEFGANKLATDTPTATDQTWWNGMRKGDTALTSYGSYPWITMMYNNINQLNTDGDRLGELCENDNDRDGMYADNVPTGTAEVDKKYYKDNCPATKQLNGSVVWVPGQPTPQSYYNATETDATTPAGDLCDSTKTYVLLRSLRSADKDGNGTFESTPTCIAHEYTAAENLYDGTAFTKTDTEGSGGSLSATMHSMLPCNTADPRQRFYMKQHGAGQGYSFYTAADRTDTTSWRLTAKGKYERDACSATTKVEEMRMFMGSDANIADINDDKQWFGAIEICDYIQERIDPRWNMVAAPASNNLYENKHPWYIKQFGKYISDFDGTCMTWANDSNNNWGLDIDASGEQHACSTGYDWRWAVLVGPDQEPWDGKPTN